MDDTNQTKYVSSISKEWCIKSDLRKGKIITRNMNLILYSIYELKLENNFRKRDVCVG